ncbi:MAG: MEDS domain-containing protein [Candidatus Omnitrophota bacterium]
MDKPEVLNSNIKTDINDISKRRKAKAPIAAEKVRKMGIDIIGDVSWGTHFCQFYQTKEDLIDILVPYFKAGLENNEFCMWVTFEPLGVEDVKKALKEKVKDLDKYITKGQIEILDHSQWYTKSGKFEADNILRGWVEKEAQALKMGFDGLRLTGNISWLEKNDWKKFADYEAAVNNAIGKHRMLAICTYSLDKCGASEIVDVVNNHQFALIRREGKWEILESSERKKVEIMEKLSHDTLVLLSDPQDTTGTIASILQLIKQSMGFEAIGVRLREGEDFPYYETKGFSEDFLLKGRYFCAREDKRNIIRDIKGNAVLECMCGSILSGRFDANLPFFTEGGSFWTNSTTDLLASTTEKERQARTRNRCNTAGYESVALIPLKAGSSIIGLLQINDRKRNSFTLDMIIFFEGLGTSIGIAFSRKKVEEALEKSEKKYRELAENMKELVYIADPKNFAAIYVNKAVEEIYGYTQKEWLSDPSLWEKTIYPEDKERLFSLLSKAQEEEDIVLEYRIVSRNKEIKWLEDRVRWQKDEKGKVVDMQGICMDTTERKKAEEELKKSESMLREQKLALEQKNLALKEMIEHIERTKNKTKEDIAINIDESLLPILRKLRLKGTSAKYLNLLQYHLKELTSSFGRKITQKNLKLTPREIEICNMLKSSLTSKEISNLLNISIQTVGKHRKNIRHKIKISSKGINLVSFLQKF